MELCPESDRLSSSWLRPRAEATACATGRELSNDCDTHGATKCQATLLPLDAPPWREGEGEEDEVETALAACA